MKLASFSVAIVLVATVACEGVQPKLPPGQALVKGDGHKRAASNAGHDEGSERDAQRAAAGGDEGGVQTPSLHVAREIAELCKLPAYKGAAHFDFDSATLAPEDRDVLSALAKCMTDGPLRGKSLALVGRTDPRGETEYNFGLGASRASAVVRYLHDLGIAPARVAPSSRGELDATGKDEASWAEDRRVDIEMASR